ASFFFSSRRRHTRFSRDWSSDVCSSDLVFGDLPKHLWDLLAGREEGGTSASSDLRTGASAFPACVPYGKFRLSRQRGYQGSWEKIGRASCRERVCFWGVDTVCVEASTTS